MTAPFEGLTWDHPRGYEALEAAAALDTPPVIHWARQPLEGFESHPIADLAARHDILVLDHPHLGEALAQHCLLPVEDWLPEKTLAAIAAATVGPALSSYKVEGRHYALPLDVATQVMARNPARISVAPDSWDEVAALAAHEPVALSLAGPHAILTFISLCVSLGSPPDGEDFVVDTAAREALARMAALARAAPAGSDRLNPIGLLEAMATSEDIALVPLVYGYVPYTAPATGRRRVAFSDAPQIGRGGRRGSVLGGTGIALTRRARPSEAVVRHLAWLMSEEAQTRFIPERSGQPSHRAAWESNVVNAAAGEFYRATRRTIDGAYVRPRFDGWIAFQTRASAVIRDSVAGAVDAQTSITALRALWHEARAGARGPLDI